MPAPQARNSARRRSRVASSQKAASRAARSRAQSSGIVRPDPQDRPLVLVGQRDVGHRQVVGVERHPDAGPLQAEQGVVLEGRDDPGLDVRGRAQVEPGPAPDQLGHEVGVVDRQRPVGDALGVDVERAPDLRGAAPLAGVGGDMEADLAGEVDGLGVDGRVGEAFLGPGEVHGDEAVGDAVGREVADEREVGLGRVRAHEGRDEVDLDPAGRRRSARARRRGLDHLPAGQALLGVEERRPADLRVADVVARLVLDEVAGDPVDAPPRPASARSAGRTP